MKFIILTKFAFFKFCLAIFGLWVLSACSQSYNKIDEAYFSLEKPFGMTWDATDKHPTQSSSDCNQLIQSLGGLINSSQKEKALLDCHGQEYSTIHLASKVIPRALRKGEISISLLGGKNPVQYNYHFLHDWTYDDFDQKRKLRISHASEIKTQLIQLYGPPSTNGYFDQGTQFGYIVKDEPNQPCSFWLINDIGILLCSERVIMVDGVEMSLSFFRIDEQVVGKKFRNMALIASGESPEPGDMKPATPTILGHSKLTLTRLAELVYNDKFNRCGKSELAPIEEIWAQSQNENATLENIYAKYSGDKLAEFVFENNNEFEDKIPDIEVDLATMLILKHAAEQGSAAAMNEIGYSLLHCNQGLEQDVDAAEKWLNQAAKAGDPMAMRSLASMYLANLIASESPKTVALTLLEQCTKVSPEICSEDFQALNAFIKPAAE